MFLLKELPQKKYLKKLFKKSDSVDSTNILPFLQFLKTSSDALVTIEKFFTDNGLSQGRFLALSIVAESDEGLFPYEIADKMGVSRATASGVVKGLVNSGYARSITLEADKRMKKVVLTDIGNKKLNEILPFYYELISKMMGTHEKVQLKNFSSMVEMIQSNVDDVK